MTISKCESAREAWIAGDGAAGTEDDGHVSSCPDCTAFAAEFREDQARLRAHFARIPIPSPAPLAPRGALDAASGYQRRVSLNLIPFLLAVILLLMLLVLALALFKLRSEGAQRVGRRAAMERVLPPSPPVIVTVRSDCMRGEDVSEVPSATVPR